MANRRPLIRAPGRTKEIPTADTFWAPGTSLFAGTATFTVAPVFTDAAGTRSALNLGSSNSVTFWTITAQVAMQTPYLYLVPGAAPGALSEGQLWAHSAGAKLQAYLGAATRDVLTGTPGSLSPTTTNSHTGATHTHAVDLLDATARLSSAAITAYPAVGPLVGQADPASGDFTAGTLLTAHVNSNRAWQLYAPLNGGSSTPQLYFRVTHTSDGGGGFTGLARVGFWNFTNNWSGLNTYSGTTQFNNAGATVSLSAAVAGATIPATCTTGYSAFVTGLGSAAAVFTCPQVHHFLAQSFTPGAGSAITNNYGFRTGNLTSGASNYSFHGGITSLAAGQWNCYMAGAAPNYFAGQVRIGSATDAGSAYGLQVSSAVFVDAAGSLFQLSGSIIPAQSTAVVVTLARSTSSGAGCRLALIGGNAATVGVNFGDTDDEDVAAVLYDHATETWTLRVAGASAYTFSATALTLPASPAAGDNSLKAAPTQYVRAAAGLGIYRTLLDSSGSLTAAQTVGTYAIGQGSPLVKTAVGSLAPPNTLYIDSADYPTTDALPPKLRIRVNIATNDVAPGATFVIGLHPITRPASSGGAGLCIYTVGAAVAGSTVTITTPAADGPATPQFVTADFALPANGMYAIGVVQSVGSIAASAHVHFSAQLQIHHA